MDAAANSPDFSASHDFAHKAAQLRRVVEELAEGAPAAAAEHIAGLKAGIEALCTEPTCVSDVARRVVHTVRTYPVQVAAAAVCAGALTWWLLSRRS